MMKLLVVCFGNICCLLMVEGVLCVCLDVLLLVGWV